MSEVGRYEEALAIYSGLIEKYGASPRLWNNKGMIYQTLGQYHHALNCYEKAIACSDDSS